MQKPQGAVSQVSHVRCSVRWSPRLYDWFSEYRLKAAGREDILEKAPAVFLQSISHHWEYLVLLKVHNHQAKIQERVVSCILVYHARAPSQQELSQTECEDECEARHGLASIGPSARARFSAALAIV